MFFKFYIIEYFSKLIFCKKNINICFIFVSYFNMYLFYFVKDKVYIKWVW